MLKVKGVELNFDITAPGDLIRYKAAGEKMEALADQTDYPVISPEEPGFLDGYIEMLNRELKLFGDFLDEVFGDGIAAQLMGNEPSLSKVIEINDAVGDALEAQGKEIGVKLQKYKPNRATRRSAKKK